jgi:hypothetical protein
VEAVAARAEAIADRLAAHGAGEVQGRSGRTPPECPDRAPPGDAVDGEPGAALEAPQRAGRAGPVAAVHRSRGEALPREEELEGGYVKPGRAGPDRSGAEPRAAAATQCPPRPAAGYPVDPEAPAALEATHGVPRPGSVPAVHVAAVDAGRAQRHLEGGHTGMAARGGSRRGKQGDRGDDRRNTARSPHHGHLFGGIPGFPAGQRRHRTREARV